MAEWNPFADPADAVDGEGMSVGAVHSGPLRKTADRSESFDSDTTADGDTSSVGATSGDEGAESARPRHPVEEEEPDPTALKRGGAKEQKGPSGNVAGMSCGECGSPFPSQSAKFCSECGAERWRFSPSIRAIGSGESQTRREHKIPRNAPSLDPVLHAEMLLMCGGDLVEPDIFDEDRSKSDLLALVDELSERYAEAPFQEELQRLCRAACLRQNKPHGTRFQFVQDRGKVVFAVQEQVLPKYGFPGTADGVLAMLAALNPFIYDVDMQRKISASEALLSLPPGSTTKACDHAFKQLVAEAHGVREVRFPGMDQKCES